MGTDKPAPPVSNHVCPHRMSLMLDNWIRRLLQNPGKIVGEYIKQGDTVVDIGCGPGIYTQELIDLMRDAEDIQVRIRQLA